HSAPMEKVLARHLLERYEQVGRMGRPVMEATDTMVVNFSLSLIQILDVDEKNQVFKTNIWYHYRWRDIILQWNPSHYDNITNIRIPSNKIWLPDILLYNFADDRLREQRDALVVVEHTGDLLWMPQAILNSSCTFDTLFFPFDDQTCHLKFGSWTYNGDKLNIDFIGGHQEINLDDYMQSNEWDLVKNVAVRNVKFYTCCPEPYPDLTFTLQMKRKVAFYTLILILPCGLLSLLTLVIFWVPPESPAKLQLGMNIFLAFFLLLLLLADFTPRAATSIPLIGAYFCLSLIMITLSTVLACIVANMYFRGIRVNRAPRWLRSCIIDGAAKLLCVNEVIQEKSTQPPTTPRKVWSTYVTGVRSQSDPETLDSLLLEEVSLLLLHGYSLQEQGGGGGEGGESSFVAWIQPPGTESNQCHQNVYLYSQISSLRELMDEELAVTESLEESQKHILEWRMIACVMDRIFFTSYITINILGLSGLLLRNYLL
ncbi:unnamed protein product, partial [Candidula unifasciata]